MAILDIFGDLYFGAASHIEENITEHLEKNPTQRFLLLRMFRVNQIDISGVHTLESVVRSIREKGGDVFLMRTQKPVLDVIKSTGFYDYLGEDHFLQYGDAIGYLFHRVLDPTICIYECEARAFKECQNLPKHIRRPGVTQIPTEIPIGDVPGISPLDLWGELHSKIPPVVVDVREPREYKRGHIPEAQSIPLFKLLDDPSQIPEIRPVVLVCRGGRRSRRATYILSKQGFMNIRMMDGGMLEWENTDLIEAID
jgi:SulP family sulfate permease